MKSSDLVGVNFIDQLHYSPRLRQLGVEHEFRRGPPPGKQVHYLKQIHSTTILPAQAASAADTSLRAEGDGLFTQNPNEPIAVRTADCLPVLIAGFSGQRSVIMAIHAGWRGLTAGILPQAIALADNLGVKPERLVLALGPAISRQAFEVGPEVVAALHANSAGLSHNQAERARVRGRDDRWHVDLLLAAILQARNCGVPASQIDALQFCTVAGVDQWHSYRRERAGPAACLGGFNWSWIALRPPEGQQ